MDEFPESLVPNPEYFILAFYNKAGKSWQSQAFGKASQNYKKQRPKNDK